MSKNLKMLMFAIIVIAVSITGCTKDDNSVSGNITYIGSITGIEYYADGANVYLMINDTEYAQKTTTDADGNYDFYPVDDGEYFVEADITVNLDLYDGESSKFTVLKDDDMSVDLTLRY